MLSVDSLLLCHFKQIVIQWDIHDQVFRDFRHAIIDIVSKHGLHNAARAAWAVRSLSPFMTDKHNDDILAATKSLLQSAGLHPNLSVHPNEPFRLGLFSNRLQPDIGLIDMAESGFHTGVFDPILFSGIWCRQQTEAREDLPLKIYDTNWKSAEEDPDTVSQLIQEDIDGQFRSGDLRYISQPPKSVGQRGWQLAA